MTSVSGENGDSIAKVYEKTTKYTTTTAAPKSRPVVGRRVSFELMVNATTINIKIWSKLYRGLAHSTYSSKGFLDYLSFDLFLAFTAFYLIVCFGQALVIIWLRLRLI